MEQNIGLPPVTGDFGELGGRRRRRRSRKGGLAARRAGKHCRYGFRKGSARCLKRPRRRRRRR